MSKILLNDKSLKNIFKIQIEYFDRNKTYWFQIKIKDES